MKVVFFVPLSWLIITPAIALFPSFVKENQDGFASPLFRSPSFRKGGEMIFMH